MNRILRSAEEPVSLEGPVGDEDSSSLGDFIEDEDAPSPMDAAAREMLREQVQHALESLSDREREVLELRFGLKDGKEHTLGRSEPLFQRDPRARAPDRGEGAAEDAAPCTQPGVAGLFGD